MKIAYGIDVQESDDPYISLAEDALDGISQAAVLGTFWVDLFPILKYVPSWFPGAGFQKKAAHWREVNAALTETPFRYVKEQMVGGLFLRVHAVVMNILQQKGRAAPSVAASLIERLPHENDPKRPMEEKVAKEVGTVAYLGVY
jgi:hypothetical protein